MCCICRKVFSFVSYLVRMSYLSWYILVHIALQFIAIIVAGSFNKSHLSQTAVKSTVYITLRFFQTQWFQNKCYMIHRDSQAASIAQQLQYLTTNLTWATSHLLIWQSHSLKTLLVVIIAILKIEDIFYID